MSSDPFQARLFQGPSHEVNVHSSKELGRVQFERSLTVPHLLGGLKECIRSRDLRTGREIHSQAVESGLLSRRVINSLIHMYAKCGRMTDARKLFDGTLNRGDHNVVTWTALITGYVDNGQCELALQLFEQLNGGESDSRLYVAALSACASLAARRNGRADKSRLVDRGRAIHSRAVRDRCCDIFVENKLIDLYSKCGSMEQAREVFDGIKHGRNVVTWTALIQGYAENREEEKALELFDRMLSEGLVPNARSFLAAISACTNLAATETRDGKLELWLDKGRALHSQAVSNRSCTIFVESSLVDMYSKCCCMREARKVFDGMVNRDVVCWNALLQGYVDNGESLVALQLFDSMEMGRDGVFPDVRTYTIAASACGSLASKLREQTETWLVKGQTIHSQAVKRRLCDIFLESTLIDMYSKCERMDLARKVFEIMEKRDTVSWTALILGYVDNGESSRALEMVDAMVAAGVSFDSTTYLAAVMACGNLTAVGNGKALHSEICRLGLDKEPALATSLVDFYGRCGYLELAERVFESINRKTTVTWTSLICGYSVQGHTDRVLELFQEMRDFQVPPNEITFVCALTACSHAGLTDRGKELFDGMVSDDGLRPNIKHFNCMVDLLARANFLEESLRLVETMPCEPDVVTWTSILDSARKLKNVGVESLAYEALMRQKNKIYNK